jgi:chemotaxis protein CheD
MARLREEKKLEAKDGSVSPAGDNGKAWSELYSSEELVNVGVAEYHVTHNPRVLACFGLGSCVGVALYDAKKKIGGLAHVMLPDSKAMTRKGNPGKFADTAIAAMVEEMEKMGSNRRDIRAKVAGGACMFSIPGAKNPRNVPGPCLGMQIGDRNIEAVAKVLEELKIKLVAEDTGGDYGRTMRFDVSSGAVTVSSIKHGVKEL